MIPIYVNDIRKSLEKGCYFSALSLALALPDICGMAEYPNKLVGERYIDWYDKYLGIYMEQNSDDAEEKNPWLSGEVVYNLRNTYLHQGSPNVSSEKIKETANQVDLFTLVISDGTRIWDSSLNIDMGHDGCTFKAIMVDVTCLCENICNCALQYYMRNREKFYFEFNFVTQSELMNPSQCEEAFSVKNFCIKVLNKKMEARRKGITDPGKILEPQQENRILYAIAEQADMLEKETREDRIRLFFDQKFKDSVYAEDREKIVQIISESKTKQQINNKLMMLYPSMVVREIYRAMRPVIQNLPGR